MTFHLLTTTLILSSGQVLLGLLAVALTLGLGIALAKKHFTLQSQKALGQHDSDSHSPTLRKYDAVSLQPHQSYIKLLGLISALTIVIIILAWTQFHTYKSLGMLGLNLESIDMDVPVTTHPPQQKQQTLPPPPTQSLEVEVADEPIVEQKLEPKQQNNSPTPSTYTGATSNNATTLPPVDFEEEEPIDEKTITISEKKKPVDFAAEMPLFPNDCSVSRDYEKMKSCADRELIHYIHSNIRYPQLAKEISVQGIAIIEFVVEVDGSITQAKIIRDPGAGCGKEALRVVKQMAKMKEKWTPGRQANQTVPVRMKLPVRFQLND